MIRGLGKITAIQAMGIIQILFAFLVISLDFMFLTASPQENLLLAILFVTNLMSGVGLLTVNSNLQKSSTPMLTSLNQSFQKYGIQTK